SGDAHARARALGLLGAAEQARLAGMPPERGEAFLFGRSALRIVLAAALGRAPTSLEIEPTPSGKPALRGRGAQVNVSHSGTWIALAVSENLPVGFDIEAARETPRALDLARRFFSADENGFLAGLAQAELNQAFLKIWTAKEALLKARGGAIPTGLP